MEEEEEEGEEVPLPSNQSTRRRSMVEQKPDGSIVVIERRMRDDGTLEMTKTKYENVSTAKEQGISISAMTGPHVHRPVIHQPFCLEAYRLTSFLI